MRRLTENDFHQRYAVQDDGCWLWTGPTINSGYGVFGARTLAHRWSYENLVGPIPEGHQVDHTCCVKTCVNPEHLRPLSPRDNTRRWADTITHCPQGHPYDNENTIQGKIRRGDKTYYTRQCRECGRIRMRAAYHKGKQA